MSEVVGLLDGGRTGILASLGRDGFPHQAAMWYVPDGPTIRMWTYGKSQKAQNLRRDPRASFLVETGDDYRMLRGVSVQGTVELSDDFETVLAVGIGLRRRYPDHRPPTREALAPQAAKRIAIVLRPDRIISWDHRRL